MLELLHVRETQIFSGLLPFHLILHHVIWTILLLHYLQPYVQAPHIASRLLGLTLPPHHQNASQQPGTNLLEDLVPLLCQPTGFYIFL